MDNDTARELRSYILALVRKKIPASDVEDIVQEAFVELLKALPEFRGDCALKTLFFRIANNKIADYHRKQKRPLPQPSDAVYDNWTEVVDVLTLEQLGAYQSEVLVLRMSGMSFREIGIVLGVRYDTARSRHRRAVKCIGETK